MSIRAIDWAFNQKCSSSSAKLVLIKLADNANDDGTCWPSMEYIAQHCELDRSSIIRNIKKLVEMGLVEVQHRFKDGVQLPNLYHLKMPVKSIVAQEHPQSHKATQVVAESTRGGGTAPHRTVIEPSIKPKSALAKAKKWEKERDSEHESVKPLLNSLIQGLT